jgi:hypothetical protein
VASALAPQEARFSGMRGAGGWARLGCLPQQHSRESAVGHGWPRLAADACICPLSGEDHQEDYPQADLQRVQGRPPEADQAREALRDLRQEAQDQGPDVLDIRSYSRVFSKAILSPTRLFITRGAGPDWLSSDLVAYCGSLMA